jgi:hypothetical protein
MSQRARQRHLFEGGFGRTKHLENAQSPLADPIYTVLNSNFMVRVNHELVKRIISLGHSV